MIEAVIDTNYRRLIDGRSIDISLGGIHNIVVGSDPDIERNIKERIKEAEPYSIPFIYDGEPELDDFLSDVAEFQRCTWHGSRGLYHALWEDGLKKK